jgi:hypothetical protein
MSFLDSVRLRLLTNVFFRQCKMEIVDRCLFLDSVRWGLMTDVFFRQCKTETADRCLS